MTDPNIPIHQVLDTFCGWASGFYSHPYFRPNSPTLGRTPSSLTEQEPKGTDKIRPSTVETFTPEEREANLDFEAGARSDTLMLGLPPERHSEIAHGTFLLSHPVYGGNVMPGLRVHFLFGEASLWAIIWCYWKLEENMSHWEKEGRGTRIGQVVVLPGANHFVSAQ